MSFRFPDFFLVKKFLSLSHHSALPCRVMFINRGSDRKSLLSCHSSMRFHPHLLGERVPGRGVSRQWAGTYRHADMQTRSMTKAWIQLCWCTLSIMNVFSPSRIVCFIYEVLGVFVLFFIFFLLLLQEYYLDFLDSHKISFQYHKVLLLLFCSIYAQNTFL